ncbi:MAG: AbrB/MazE/SpoVT family DNA-binding domain-containing protein [Candidatus Thermoplasmatota archaeon]|nr:AbrB/MazE/SpoVT family DNA-binding domain-containing protein [Candidatus Thermoplasmatota archaeon]
MAIKRKVRMAGESLAVTIPSQIAQLHDIKEGDYLEFAPIGYGEFKIKKV